MGKKKEKIAKPHSRKEERSPQKPLISLRKINVLRGTSTRKGRGKKKAGQEIDFPVYSQRRRGKGIFSCPPRKSKEDYKAIYLLYFGGVERKKEGESNSITGGWSGRSQKKKETIKFFYSMGKRKMRSSFRHTWKQRGGSGRGGPQ